MISSLVTPTSPRASASRRNSVTMVALRQQGMAQHPARSRQLRGLEVLDQEADQAGLTAACDDGQALERQRGLLGQPERLVRGQQDRHVVLQIACMHD